MFIVKSEFPAVISELTYIYRRRVSNNIRMIPKSWFRFSTRRECRKILKSIYFKNKDRNILEPFPRNRLTTAENSKISIKDLADELGETLERHDIYPDNFEILLDPILGSQLQCLIYICCDVGCSISRKKGKKPVKSYIKYFCQKKFGNDINDWFKISLDEKKRIREEHNILVEKYYQDNPWDRYRLTFTQ